MRPNQVTLICRTCTNPFSVPASKAHRSKYCSKQCYRSSHAPRPGRRTGATLPCVTCGVPFYMKRSEVGARRYCSRECELKDHKRKRHGFEDTCARCGAAIYVPPPQIRRSKTGKYYCSNACVYLSITESKQTMTCDQCGVTFHRPASSRRGAAHQFCSPTCAAAWQVGKPQRRRKRPIRRKRFGVKETLYRGYDWKQQSKACRERDNYTCQHCGKTGVRLDAHHIVPYRLSHNNDLSNLITLCRGCHNTAEAEYWRKHPVAQLPMYLPE